MDKGGDESGPQVEDFKYLRNLLEVGKREDGLKAASSVRCGEERTDHKGEAVDLLVDQCSFPRLWPWVLGTDQKNKIVDAGGEAFSKKKVEKLVIGEGSEGSCYDFA